MRERRGCDSEQSVTFNATCSIDYVACSFDDATVAPPDHEYKPVEHNIFLSCRLSRNDIRFYPVSMYARLHDARPNRDFPSLLQD